MDAAHNAAVFLGRRGGSAKSPAKASAARRNGAKGGRPRLPHCKDCTAWLKPNCYPPLIREWKRSGLYLIPGVDPARACPRFVRKKNMS